MAVKQLGKRASGLTDAATLADIAGASSLGSSGYQKFASGLIIQWGHTGSASGGNGTVTLPAAFPNACASVILTSDYSGANSTTLEGASAYSLSTTGFSWSLRYAAGGGTGGAGEGVFWMAIGY